MKIKMKIYLLLILIITALSCNWTFKELFDKTSNNKANIEITINKENNHKINKLIDVLNFRFDKYGIIAKFDRTDIINNKLHINVRNYKNIEELKSLLINQGVFEITSEKAAGAGDDIFANSLNDRFVKSVMVLQSRKALFLNFELFDYYKERFSDFTDINLGKQIKFILDGKLFFKPTIRERIRNGQIKLYFPDITFKELMLYEMILLSGPLPVKLNNENINISKIVR